MELKKVVVGPLQSNVYIISSKGEGIIIDAGAEADKILPFTNGISIKYILLTHNHFDHTDALGELKNKLGVKCGIHSLDKTTPLFDFEFSDKDKFNFGEAFLEVIHTPGHTPGGCCFLIPKAIQEPPIFISGDTIFQCGYGRTDLGGSEVELFKSIKKIMSLSPDIKVYPGHGPSTTIGEEQKFYSSM